MRRYIILGIALVLISSGAGAQDKRPTDTPKAAKSRKKLKEKISVDYENTAIREVQADLVSQIEGLPLRVDFKGGVSGNLTITYKADKKTLEEVLDGMCKKKGGLGYYIESATKSADDGTIWISNRPNERGFRIEEADAMPEKGDTKTAKKDKSKNKSKDKDDAEAKDKKSTKEKGDATDKAEDDPDKAEKDAARKLNFAKILLNDGKTEKAKGWLDDIVTKFPKTKAAEEAKELLKKLDK